VLKWSSNGSGETGQESTWLEIATQLAGELGQQIGYYFAISRVQMRLK